MKKNKYDYYHFDDEKNDVDDLLKWIKDNFFL